MRFINDDVTLKHGGRKAVRISEQELWNKMVERALAVDDDGLLDEEMDNPYNMNDENNYMVIQTLFFNDATIAKDIKFSTEAENFTMDPHETFDNDIKGKPLVGFHTLENGLTFVGVELGGDSEYSFFTIFYFDGKKIRCYSPSYGNQVNLDTKSALGNDGYTNSGCARCVIYCKKYGLNCNQIGYNWDAIKKDIMARIIVTE